MAESRCLLAGGSLVFGSFRCASDDPLWNAENCMPHGHHIVFPRVPVLISGIQEREVVAAPNTLMFYNRGDQYRRRAVDERGDACEWLIVSDTLLWDLLRELDPDRHGSPDRPFAHRAAPSVPRCYAAQRLIWQELAHGAAPDALALEESLLALLPEILSTAQRAWRRRPVPRRPSTHRANQDAVVAIQSCLARHYRSGVTLDQVARSANLSVYHAARVFHAYVGLPVHKYLKRLRLSAALESFVDRQMPLAEVALTVGFASQSHFTDAFRQEFGVPPGTLRRADARARLLQIRKISEEAATCPR